MRREKIGTDNCFGVDTTHIYTGFWLGRVVYSTKCMSRTDGFMYERTCIMVAHNTDRHGTFRPCSRSISDGILQLAKTKSTAKESRRRLATIIHSDYPISDTRTDRSLQSS